MAKLTETDAVNAYFKQFYPPYDLLRSTEPRWSMVGFERRVPGYDRIFPALVCADGLSLSVQGHWGGYCHPRDDFADEYVLVEILGPPRADPLLDPYERECNAVGDQMIYPYVPVQVVSAVIANHGGIAAGRAALQEENPRHD